MLAVDDEMDVSWTGVAVFLVDSQKLNPSNPPEVVGVCCGCDDENKNGFCCCVEFVLEAAPPPNPEANGFGLLPNSVLGASLLSVSLPSSLVGVCCCCLSAPNENPLLLPLFNVSFETPNPVKVEGVPKLNPEDCVASEDDFEPPKVKPENPEDED